MSGYVHGARREIEEARTVFEKARIQGARLIAEAKIRAESEANLIREKAYLEGLARADAQLHERERSRREEANSRLRAATYEAYPTLHDSRLAS